MAETYTTTMVPHAAVLAAIDPIRSTVAVARDGFLADGAPQCWLTVAAPNVRDLADRLHMKDGKRLESIPAPLNVTAMMTALHAAISRIKAGEAQTVTVKAWEVCRG